MIHIDGAEELLKTVIHFYVNALYCIIEDLIYQNLSDVRGTNPWILIVFREQTKMGRIENYHGRRKGIIYRKS